MDPFHERLARVALDAAGSFGFALAGGYAVQAHGFLNRMSSDVDLFAEASAVFDFTQAVDMVIAAYLREGFHVETELRNASFARLNVRSAAESAKVEMGLDWRKNEPVRLAVGPVLHADDAVANKVCALFGRAEVRDYVDVDAILTSSRYTEDQLLDLAAEHDPGFDLPSFAEALAAIDRLPDSLFRPYGMSSQDSAALRERYEQTIEMYVPGRGCRVPSQDNAIRTNGTCAPREVPELADLRALCGTASRNFYCFCCFRTLRGSRPNPGGVGGSFPALAEISRAATTP